MKYLLNEEDAPRRQFSKAPHPPWWAYAVVYLLVGSLFVFGMVTGAHQ